MTLARQRYLRPSLLVLHLLYLCSGVCLASLVYELQLEGDVDNVTCLMVRLPRHHPPPLAVPADGTTGLHDGNNRSTSGAAARWWPRRQRLTEASEAQLEEAMNTTADEDGAGGSSEALGTSALVALGGGPSGSIMSTGEVQGATTTLRELSICMAFSVKFFNLYSTLVSYATRGDSNTFIFGVRPSLIKIHLGGRWFHVRMGIYQDCWYMLCLVQGRQRLTLYLDGHHFRSWEVADGREVPLGGVLVVGQEQDELGGGFTLTQALPASVSLVTLWPRLLSPSEVLHLAACHDLPTPGAIVSWGEQAWKIQGRVKKVTVGYCEGKSRKVFLFRKKTTFEKAEQHVRSLGMTLVVPETPSEVSSLRKSLWKANIKCASNYANRSYLWTNIIYDPDTNTTIDVTRNTSYELYDNGWHPLGGRILLTTDGWFFCKHCSLPRCYAGEYTSTRPLFLLHGLCHQSSRSKFYSSFVLSVDSDGQLYFSGLYHLSIRKAGHLWSIFHHRKNVTLATTRSTVLPVGRREWAVTGADETCSITKNRLVKLILSRCSRDQFTCTDGSCIPIVARCDLSCDCRDGSDEEDCELLTLPEGYVSQLPPTLPINFSLNLCFDNVMIHLLDMTVTLEMIFTLRWYDSRIKFYNLRPGSSTNRVLLGSHTLWLPIIQIKSVVNEDQIRAPKSLLIDREANGTWQGRDMVYEGSQNAVVYTQTRLPTVRCPFFLEMYPWDLQHCGFLLNITNVKAESIRFVNFSLHYLGNEEIQEYFIHDWHLDVSQKTGRVRFKLRRGQQQLVWSTYLPTALLLLISYGTLYIPARSFSYRGNLSVMTMLVLVSLYTKSLSRLPTTAYNKLIDLWYLFTITYVSLIIATHLATSHPVTTLPKKELEQPVPRQQCRGGTSSVHLVLARILFGLILIAFCIIFLCKLPRE